MNEEKFRLFAFFGIVSVCLILMVVFTPKPPSTTTTNQNVTKNVEKSEIKSNADKKEPSESVTAKEAPAKPEDSPEKETEKKPKPLYNVADTPENDPKKVEIKTKLFRMVFNTKGGILETLELNDFKQTYKKDSPLYKLIDKVKKNQIGCFSILGFEDAFAKATFEVSTSKKDLITTVTMESIKNGIKVEKIFSINENEYDFNFHVKVTNLRSSEVTNNMRFVGVMDMEFDFKDMTSFSSDQIVSMIEEDGDFITAGDVHWVSKTYGARQGLIYLKEEPFVMGPIRKTKNGKHDNAKVVWSGLKNRYFTVIYKPRKLDWSVNGIDLNPNHNDHENCIPQLIWVPAETKLAAGQSWEETMLVYAGPMKVDIINSARYEGNKFVEMIDYGFMFPRFIKVFDWILNFIIKFIGESQYWLAIILLTLLVRGCMFPITKKSSMSQAKLQAITPKMKDLKEKYKNDTKKLNEEMMKLYRTEGVNPFTSCLPMLIQMPIFIGLYWTFNLTFEVRFKHFLWINDLAVDDHLFPLGFTLPLLGSYFNLLPILYSVINYITMANMPPAQDEMQAQQQKIMKYMFPVMMLLFFYRMPSALVLYFIVSGTWSIIEQKKIRQKLDAMKAATK